ncbi:MAG: transposase [Bacteroidales bacterium]
MSQSLSKLYVHLVFHIKTNSCIIRNQDQYALYAYIASIIKERESMPIIVNGVKDHVHILFILSKNIAISDLVKDIKRHSSRWIKGLDPFYSQFNWQRGYGAFSVSSSLHDKTRNYILNQEKHHYKMTFREEYLLFLKEYKIDYKEEYLWND